MKIMTYVIVAAMLAVGVIGANVNKELASVRQATAKYHDYEAAIADGYVNTMDLVTSPDGVMGIHFMHPNRSMDDVLDPLMPEGLLYIPQNNGYKLVAVEYFIASAYVNETPMLFGKEFDGPMPGHEPGMPEHYDLHVWLWHGNPEGIFAPFNPNVHVKE